MRRFAAIDIGSNAVRLQVGQAGGGRFIGELFTRVPLQLGKCAFANGNLVPEEKLRQLTAILSGLRLIAMAMAPAAMCAVATAAVRDCRNRARLLADSRCLAKVPIDILSGEEEAALVGALVGAQMPAAKTLLNIDTGGGSTDCSLIQYGSVVAAETFRIGTARAGGGAAAEKTRFHHWLAARASDGVLLAGSGGGIRKLKEICGDLSAQKLRAQKTVLAAMTPGERIAAFGLTPDRAESILPATDICLSALQSTNAAVIHPVTGGLCEAVIRRLAKTADSGR